MNCFQYDLRLPPFRRGLHLITDRVIAASPDLPLMQIGLLHIFLKHTSASLCINENAAPDVPADLETALNRLVPEDFPYRHDCEGPDDMPAHVKSALLGCELTIPVRDGRLALGMWQGIYLCEHRDRASGRHLVLTLYGEVLSRE
jgi:secondary thiamine-phosphate synthase enzyme